MFYQNSNRSDLSTKWDSKNRHLGIKGLAVYQDDIWLQWITLDELADLRDMIGEILDLEKYKDE